MMLRTRSFRLGLGVVVSVTILLTFLWPGPAWEVGELALGLGALGLLVVGFLLVLRVPENRISWVMIVVAIGFSLVRVSELVGNSPVGYFINGLGLFALVLPGLCVYLPLWFPTGDAVSPRWRLVGWLAVVGAVLLLAGVALVSWVEFGDSSSLGGCDSIGTCSGTVGLLVILLAVLLAVLSFIVRWVRSEGVERLQLRWLVPVFIVLGIGVGAEFGGAQDSLVATGFITAGLLLVPLAIAVAVLRYRLYEIDRIISRTVSYTVVVVVLAGVYVAGVTWLSSLLPDQSQLVVAATTLAVAALFNPVRRRVQGLVDRRFNRSRYDTQRVMDGFAGSLRDQVDAEAVVDGWLGVVSETMQPTLVAVWTKATFRNDSGTIPS